MKRADRMIQQLRAQARRGDVRSFQSYQMDALASTSSNGGARVPVNTGYASAGMVGSSPMPLQSPTPGNVASAAQFGLKLKRLTAAIAQTLPVPMFNPIDAQAAYAQSVGGLQRPGVRLSNVKFGTNGGFPDKMQLTYTDGVGTDIVEVTCTSTDYPSFLASLITDKFNVNKIRMTLSDPAQLIQFDERLTANTLSMFGRGETNSVTPSNFKSPQQYQEGIVDVDLDFKFDKQTALVLPLIPVAAFSVSLNFFCPRFDQSSARYW